MVPRLLVFDLDGTLIDSRVDLCNSVNAMLVHLGKPTLPDGVIASYIGDGAHMLVRRALGDPEGDVHDEEYVAGALAFFLDWYRIHKLDFTYVYEGVFEALEEFRREIPGVRMAVLTNKPVRPSRDICAYLGLDRFFFQNYGGNSFHTKKPDPKGLLTLIEEASALEGVGREISPRETVMIGDSDVDILTARNCGAWAVGCTFGLAPHSLVAARPDGLADSPGEWVGVVRKLQGVGSRE
jgi:phosphoglycolate phosphatase